MESSISPTLRVGLQNAVAVPIGGFAGSASLMPLACLFDPVRDGRSTRLILGEAGLSFGKWGVLRRFVRFLDFPSAVPIYEFVNKEYFSGLLPRSLARAIVKGILVFIGVSLSASLLATYGRVTWDPHFSWEGASHEFKNDMLANSFAWIVAVSTASAFVVCPSLPVGVGLVGTMLTTGVTGAGYRSLTDPSFYEFAVDLSLKDI